MITLQEILRDLHEILNPIQGAREPMIRQLQNKIWDGDTGSDEELNEILSELAYDLDFYEPDTEMRKESDGFFDQERLVEMVNFTIRKLEMRGKIKDGES